MRKIVINQERGLKRIRSKDTTKKKESFLRYIKKNYELYLMIFPSLVCLLMFRYVPILGNLIAFQKYRPTSSGTFLGSILENQWVGSSIS